MAATATRQRCACVVGVVHVGVVQLGHAMAVASARLMLMSCVGFDSLCN
jgi:hypothetical protein